MFFAPGFRKFISILILSLITNFCFSQNTNNEKENAIGADSVKSQKAIALVLDYVRLLQNKNIDSVIALSGIQFKWVIKWSSEPEGIEIFKTLSSFRNALKVAFDNSKAPVLLNLDSIYVTHVNLKFEKKKVNNDEVYFVMMISKYGSGEGNTNQRFKTIFAVRMIDRPKIIGLIEE